MLWTAQSEELTADGGLRFSLHRGSNPATFDDVILAWQDDAVFQSWFNSLLADLPYRAFRWETPPVTADTVTRQFEFVVLDRPGLARRPNPSAFDEHFRDAPPSEVVTFPNLPGDAMMVVPCPLAEPTAYGHLAAFVRLAPERQRNALWQAVGRAMHQRLSPKPVWLNTAGGGVSWLHVRLDNRPKYYGFEPYRKRSN